MKTGLAALAAVVIAVALLPATAGATQGSSASTKASPKGGAGISIVGGSETTFDKHPWQVQITLNGGAFCGGALVHPRLVLTAAHCLWNAQANNYWGNLGYMQAFTSRTITEQGGEELQLAPVVGIPQNYNPLPGTGENDWGFLILSSSSSRPTLKIAGSNERSLWKDGTSAIVAGFGDIQSGGPSSQTLKQASVTIQSDATCGSLYGTDFHLANMLCAGVMAGGTGSCQGDSGGPLTVGVDGGGRRIVGVVSFGQNCAAPNKPAIYTRVAEPGVASQINAMAADIAQSQGFPGMEQNTNLLGSGAKRPGCSAAQSAANSAKSAADAAKGAANKAQKAVKKANQKAKKAAKKVSSARKLVRFAAGNMKKAARKQLKRAQKAASKAKKAASKAKKVAKRQNAAAKAAAAKAASAQASASATCG